MKKLSFIVAFLCASMLAFAIDEVYDVNFALASNGSSATASSGTAANAIDGNEGTRWESAQTDDETWTLDMGQQRIFNSIKILWEGAFAKEFTLSYSNDGENWTSLYVEENLTKSGWQLIEVSKTTAQYIQYHGTKRATQWGQSFYEFQVFLPGESVLTKIELKASSNVAKVGEGIALTTKALDQNDKEMDVAITYEVTPAAAGTVSEGKYIPAQVGNASIVAKSGTVTSDAIKVFGYEGSNLALSTNLVTDNKIVAQIAENPDGSANDAYFAVDGNDGSVWQGSLTNGTAGDEASRTYDAWFVVDLGGKYSIDLITIHFEGACSQDYHVDFSDDNTVWSLGYNYVGTAGINGRTDMLDASVLDNNAKVRYVRFWSTKAGTEWGVKVFEFQVFGREYVPAGDTEKPVMVSAALESKTWNSAVIAVAATDNDEVAKFHVVDAAKSIDAKYAPTDGKITVTGLTAATAYNFTITAIDAAQNESENSKSVAVTTDERIIVPSTAAPTPTWPAAQVKSIYSDAYTFAPASLNSYNEGWWDNPTLTIDSVAGDHFLHYDLYRNGMIGAQWAEVSVATMEKIHIDVWASVAGSVTFRPITAGDADAINANKKTLTLEAQKWNSFDFDMADFGDHNWTRSFQYAIEGYQAGGLVGEHIAVDNIYFYRTTALVDDEKPTNVSGSMVSASYFSVVLALKADDNSGAVSFVVKKGDKEVATGSGASGVTVNVTVSGLTPNTEYSFSVIAKDEAGNEADAINVSAKTADGAPAAAPKPDFTDKEAVAVFCDALESGPEIKIGGWGQATVAQVVELAEGDKAFYCSNTNYLGWELTPAVDATDMEYVHADFYATEITSIQLTPISPGKEGIFTVDLKAGEWTSVDVELATAYADKGIVWSNIFQFKFMEAAPAGKELFIDNVYFWKDSDQTAIEDVQIDKVQCTKVIRDGVLYIIHNGAMYNVQGQKVK